MGSIILSFSSLQATPGMLLIVFITGTLFVIVKFEVCGDLVLAREAIPIELNGLISNLSRQFQERCITRLRLVHLILNLVPHRLRVIVMPITTIIIYILHPHNVIVIFI